jgi:hypothetical protein
VRYYRRKKVQEVTSECVRQTWSRRLVHRHTCSMNPQIRQVFQNCSPAGTVSTSGTVVSRTPKHMTGLGVHFFLFSKEMMQEI